MFDIYCSVCDRSYLMSTSSIEEFHNTEEGPVIHTTCVAGHPVIRYFRAGRARTENVLTTAG